jgi:hypothetical protein
MDRGGLAKRLLSSGRLSGRGSGRASLRLVAASAVLGTRARARARAVLPVQALVSSSSGSSGSFSATRSFSTAPGSGTTSTGSSTGSPPLHRDTRYVTSACDPHTRALVPPLHLSTTYERDEQGELSGGFMYSRLGNPTRAHFEQAFTALECGGGESLAFSSGMQAATAVLQSCPGAHVILPDDLYHGVSE